MLVALSKDWLESSSAERLLFLALIVIADADSAVVSQPFWYWGTPYEHVVERGIVGAKQLQIQADDHSLTGFDSKRASPTALQAPGDILLSAYCPSFIAILDFSHCCLLICCR